MDLTKLLGEWLEGLRSVQWFARTGMFEDCERAGRVRSWPLAVSLSNSDAWGNAQLYFANALRRRIGGRSKEAASAWNAVVVELRPRVEATIDPPINDYLRVRSLPNSVLQNVRWDLLHIGMAIYYAEIVPLETYEMFWQLYKDGFFPCGREGEEPPGGRLLVL